MKFGTWTTRPVSVVAGLRAIAIGTQKGAIVRGECTRQRFINMQLSVRIVRPEFPVCRQYVRPGGERGLNVVGRIHGNLLILSIAGSFRGSQRPGCPDSAEMLK